MYSKALLKVHDQEWVIAKLPSSLLKNEIKQNELGRLDCLGRLTQKSSTHAELSII